MRIESIGMDRVPPAAADLPRRFGERALGERIEVRDDLDVEIGGRRSQ
jgi:hypothetical protein